MTWFVRSKKDHILSKTWQHKHSLSVVLVETHSIYRANWVCSCTLDNITVWYQLIGHTMLSENQNTATKFQQARITSCFMTDTCAPREHSKGGKKKRKIWGKEIKWEDTARTPVLLCSACAHCCVERSALALSGPCKRGGHSPACRAVLSSIVPTTHPEGLVPPGAPHMTQSLVFRVHCPQWDSTKSGNKATV